VLLHRQSERPETWNRIMKNTSRIHRKINPETQSSQGKKPAIHSQKAATIGQVEINTAGKVTLGAVRIGEAIGLNANEIKALALLSNWDGQTPSECCRDAVLHILQTGKAIVKASASPNHNYERKVEASKLIPALDELLPDALWTENIRPKLEASTEKALFDCLCEVEDAVRQSEALQQLMLIAIDSEDSLQLFRGDGGSRAAGVQSLLWQTETKVSSACDKMRTAINRARD